MNAGSLTTSRLISTARLQLAGFRNRKPVRAGARDVKRNERKGHVIAMTDQPPDDGEYRVGYGRPPRHSQILPGEKRNPKGRPKGSRNLRTDVKRALKKKVYVVENGKRRTISTQEAVILKLREKALKADDVRASSMFLKLATDHNNEPPPPAVDGPVSAEDEAIVAAFLARQRPPPPGEASSPKAGTETPTGGDPPIPESDQSDDDQSG